jgi:hypothetical protein
LLRDLFVFRGQGEGFNYLGLGVILLGLLALSRLAAKPIAWRSLARHAPLAAYCLALFLFSLSNRVTYGDRFLVVLPMGPLESFCATFRSSGRFFWPVYYVIVCATIRLILARCPKGWARALLVVALVVQAIDLSGFIAQTRHEFLTTPRWRSSLRDPAWEALGKRYRKVIVVPANFIGVDYANLAFFAVTHRMTINVAYLARYNKARQFFYRNRLIEDVANGVIDPQGLYVTRDNAIAESLKKHLRSGERLVRLNGHVVYAPGITFVKASLPTPPS